MKYLEPRGKRKSRKCKGSSKLRKHREGSRKVLVLAAIKYVLAAVGRLLTGLIFCPSESVPLVL
jgi:hypothetical protein